MAKIVNMYGATPDWVEIAKGAGETRLFLLYADIGTYAITYKGRGIKTVRFTEKAKGGAGKFVGTHKRWAGALKQVQADYDKRKG